jgi:hypothetical protein
LFHKLYDFFSIKELKPSLFDPFWKDILNSSVDIPQQLQSVTVEDKHWRLDKDKVAKINEILKSVKFSDFWDMKKADKFKTLPVSMNDWFNARHQEVPLAIKEKVQLSTLTGQDDLDKHKIMYVESSTFPPLRPEPSIIDITGSRWNRMKTEVNKIKSQKGQKGQDPDHSMNQLD